MTASEGVSGNPSRFRVTKPLKVRSTNIAGVYAFPDLRAAFDPTNASAETLLHSGFPLRPSRRADERQRSAWNAFAKSFPTKLIVPRLTPQVGVRHVAKGLKEISNSSVFSSYNWSGAAVGPGAVSAWGTWTIPPIQPSGLPPSNFLTPDNQVAQGWSCSSWVGLDGLGSGDITGVSSTSVLQAGVTTSVDTAGNYYTSCWYEWYTPAADANNYNSTAAYQAVIYEFPWLNQVTMDVPVQPGDEVGVYLLYIEVDFAPATPEPAELNPVIFDAPAGQYGQISFSLPNTQEGFALLIPEPPQAQPIGQCAE